MRVLLIGDPHFKVSNAVESEALSKHIISVVKERKPDLVVNLGDTLDTHNKAEVYPFTRAVNFMLELAEIVPTVMIIGNHDRPNNSDFQSPYHFFSGMKKVPNLTIVDKATVVKIGEHSFLCVPYVPPGRFKEAIFTVCTEEELKGMTAVFAHQEFYHAKMGSILSEVGDKWELDLPVVYSGHIHEYQILQENVIYVGSPIPHGFGDKGSYGLYEVNWNGKERKDERLLFTIRERKTYKIKASEVKEFEPKHESKHLLPPLVRIVITGTQAELKSANLQSKVAKWKEKGYKVQFKAERTETILPASRPCNRSYLDRLYEALNEKQRAILREIVHG